MFESCILAKHYFEFFCKFKINPKIYYVLLKLRIQGVCSNYKMMIWQNHIIGKLQPFFLIIASLVQIQVLFKCKGKYPDITL